jgi:hypothetical protein
LTFFLKKKRFQKKHNLRRRTHRFYSEFIVQRFFSIAFLGVSAQFIRRLPPRKVARQTW